jgi:hypothetical protein
MADTISNVGLRKKLGGVAKKRVETYLPPSFRAHLKASIREAFLAFESLLDEAVKSLEKGEKKAPVPRVRKTRKGA